MKTQTTQTKMSTTKTKTPATKSNKHDKNWLQSKSQRRSPKIFEVKLIQLQDGNFHIIGGESKVLIKRNQHSSEWVNVNTRDMASALNANTIKSL